jgi:hypothetical protein
MTELQRFLVALAGQPFGYGGDGVRDCALPIADWWQIKHGVDPAAHLRGAYRDHNTCVDLLMREGGLLRLVWKLAKSVGAPRTKYPRAGDFAVVRLDKRHFGAILTDDGFWFIKCDDGVLALRDVRVVAAWSIQCPS